jgi:hypothetical protein
MVYQTMREHREHVSLWMADWRAYNAPTWVTKYPFQNVPAGIVCTWFLASAPLALLLVLFWQDQHPVDSGSN